MSLYISSQFGGGLDEGVGRVFFLPGEEVAGALRLGLFRGTDGCRLMAGRMAGTSPSEGDGLPAGKVFCRRGEEGVTKYLELKGSSLSEGADDSSELEGSSIATSEGFGQSRQVASQIPQYSPVVVFTSPLDCLALASRTICCAVEREDVEAVRVSVEMVSKSLWEARRVKKIPERGIMHEVVDEVRCASGELQGLTYDRLLYSY